jgi:hypothetical protein
VGLLAGLQLKNRSKEAIKKIWKVVIYPTKATGDLIFRSREELVKGLKKIGLNDSLILLLCLRGLIPLNMNGERLLVQLVEIVEKVKIG